MKKQQGLFVVAAIGIVALLAVAITFIFKAPAHAPRTVVIAPPPKPPPKSRLLPTTGERPAKAIDVTINFENDAAATAQLSFKTPLRPPPGLPAPGPLAPLAKGLSRVDLADFPNGSHFLDIKAPGYCSLWIYVKINNGRIEEPSFDVTLYRPRYAIIRWAFNTKGGRELDGPNVDQGRAAVSHWGQLPHFGQDWQVWQGSSTDHSSFGDTLMLAMHRIGRNGFAPAPESATFDDLKTVPDDVQFIPRDQIANPGLLLFCYVSGNRNVPPDSGFGKVLIESVSTTRPSGIHVYQSTR